MNDIAFADATRPTRCVILRLALLDYSLGHELILLSQHNPLVTLTREEFSALDVSIQRSSVIRAVLVCSRSWLDNKNPHRWLRLWSWFNRKADYALAIADFRNYRAAGSTFPIITPPERIGKECGRDLGSPHLTRILNFGMMRFGFPCMDLPLGFLQWLYFSEVEMEGNVFVENTYEKQIREELAQHQADYAREQAEKKAKEAQCQA